MFYVLWTQGMILSAVIVLMFLIMNSISSLMVNVMSLYNWRYGGKQVKSITKSSVLKHSIKIKRKKGFATEKLERFIYGGAPSFKIYWNIHICKMVKIEYWGKILQLCNGLWNSLEDTHPQTLPSWYTMLN